MKEDLITLETATLAYKKGCRVNTNKITACVIENDCGEKRPNVKTLTVNIMTQALLAKWLREEHKIKISIVFRESFKTGKETWDWLIKGESVMYRRFKTYEQALEHGLLEGLKLIKQ